MKAIKIIIGVVAIFFISIFIIAIMNNSMRRWSDFKQEPLKSNITEAFKSLNMDTSKIASIGKDTDWSNGPRYKIGYKGDEYKIYYIYTYEDGQVVSIKDGANNIYSNNNIKVENLDSSAITIRYNELGEYGKYVTFDGTKYMVYILPAGEYEVSALVKNSMFYIEKSKIYKNSSGHDDNDTVSTVQFSEIGSKKTITLKSDEWISLVINSAISLKKVD